MLQDYGRCRDCGTQLALVGHHPDTGQCHPCWMAAREPSIPEWVRRAQERRLPAVDTSGLVRMGGAL
jgi:recombinational DNA repair protein (RecF pathway)